MPAGTMFAKFKSTNVAAATTSQSVAEGNPITQYFEIGKPVACAGPELAWRIHDAYRKSDNKECSVFIFEKKVAEKLHKPRRKETITELLKSSVKTLERFRHPRILQIYHTVEESADTLAFASEPIFASLSNVLAFHESKTYDNANVPAAGAGAGSAAGMSPAQTQGTAGVQPQRPAHAKEYSFLDMELKYGFLQLTEALAYLHYSGHVIHRNVCPSSVLITKRGIWKLAGMEYVERMNETDLNSSIPCPPWSNRVSKMAQPNLDFMAPETQSTSKCSLLSDMFSLGMVICAVFNNGRPLIQAGNSTSNYAKQMETLDDMVHKLMPRLPIALQEATSRMASRDATARPTAQLLQLIKYFIDPAINALKFLDVVNMKDTQQKSQFYKTTLIEAMPVIPRKLWWQTIWPMLKSEINNNEVLAAVLQPVMLFVQEATHFEYDALMSATMKIVYNTPKSIQASVTILENLHLIIEKTKPEDVTTDIMPMLFCSFDGSTIQVQSAAVVAVANVFDSIDELSIRRMVLPKVKLVFEKNITDPKIVQNVLMCIERVMDRMERAQVMEEVLPLLANIRIPDPDIIMRTVRIYHKLFVDKSYGLSVETMATNVLPLLIPHTVNPALNFEHYCYLLEVLQQMLEAIDRQQRNKLKLDNLSMASPERHRTLRHQFSTDNMNAPPFNIPNLRIDQRKTSSAEDMARKNSGGSGMLGGWWFGCSPSSPDSNFLRVGNVFPNRRLSDNTLMTPKIRIAPSCASSPGGTPGSGLPTRRHSSIGPQERRGSAINLSPPTYGGARGSSGSSLSVPSTSVYVKSPLLYSQKQGGSMPNTSSSVPFLLSSSMQSIRSRRQSTVLSSGPLGSGSGILQQLGSGMVRQLTSVSGTVSPVPLLRVNGARNSISHSHTNVRKCPSLNITFSQ
ncbi:SCY1-like protein 2 isoform X4 [Drosophila obscura]|uniref:SCY1-like protein 2 isoform X4 n=1 Tax=Drosophila obscura TaxID=7282 RepID=UPI000BA08C5E|nr:SCY1-like protein 2 isoform X4 [Drosophila obscura]XP_041450062.1 SCY1-like protein 2 isoform X4 [Drosophila obscura]XP_041450063.1 SCY1-like protein 2 isoform X4 [Drosophila obscura]XP_041450064.1 SCY1-like protein 2 isoform X4 [Drosophila obscura]